MKDSFRDTYVQTAALHRERLSHIRPPERKADVIARAFTEWLSMSQFLHFMEVVVLPGMAAGATEEVKFRKVDKQFDLDRFRRIDPRSVRRAMVAGSTTGRLKLRLFESLPPQRGGH